MLFLTTHEGEERDIAGAEENLRLSARSDANAPQEERKRRGEWKGCWREGLDRAERRREAGGVGTEKPAPLLQGDRGGGSNAAKQQKREGMYRVDNHSSWSRKRRELGPGGQGPVRCVRSSRRGAETSGRGRAGSKAPRAIIMCQEEAEGRYNRNKRGMKRRHWGTEDNDRRLDEGMPSLYKRERKTPSNLLFGGRVWRVVNRLR